MRAVLTNQRRMEGEQLYYTSGEDVQLGDRVQLDGAFATVVAVSNGDDYQLAPGYEDYAGLEHGVVVCDDDGSVSTIGETDPRLIFVDRGSV
jgi:hypothetical protein